MFYVYNGSVFFFLPQWGQTNKHSHTGLLLVHAVASAGAGGSGWQDAQEDVHLQTIRKLHQCDGTDSTAFFLPAWQQNPCVSGRTVPWGDTCGSDDVVMTQHHQLTELKPRRTLLCSQSTAPADAAGWHRGDCQGLTDTAMAMGPAKLQISVSYMESQQKSGFP